MYHLDTLIRIIIHGCKTVFNGFSTSYYWKTVQKHESDYELICKSEYVEFDLLIVVGGDCDYTMVITAVKQL
jgi:hypothetical protein